MKKQRGQALILVLIALAVGSLLIFPALQYVSTGLIGARVSEKLLLNQYAADAAVEYTLWQLTYDVDGLTTGLDPDNPSSTDTITVNGIDVPVTASISVSPETDDGTLLTLTPESGVHLGAAMDILPPSWTEPGESAQFTHLVYVYNYGTSESKPKALYQQLDPRLTYEAGSYAGPPAVVTATLVDGHWELVIDLDTPLPTLDPDEGLLISFKASGEANTDEEPFETSGWVTYAGFDEDMVFSGDSGPASFGLYDITATVGGYTLLVNIGITEEGDLVLRSYQVQ